MKKDTKTVVTYRVATGHEFDKIAEAAEHEALHAMFKLVEIDPHDFKGAGVCRKLSHVWEELMEELLAIHNNVVKIKNEELDNEEN